MNRAYRIALICGTLPLIVGVSVYLFWLMTRWYGWVVMGVFTLLFGVILFLVGTVALARFVWLAFRTSGLSRRRLWFSTLACLGLLVANFPAAYGIMLSVFLIEASYTITVHNASDQPLDGVRVFGGGCDAWFGTVPPGGRVQRSFLIRDDGQLEFQAVRRAIRYTETIDKYVTQMMSGNTTVTFESEGKISVSGTGAPR
jgi:hypothetical protein